MTDELEFKVSREASVECPENTRAVLYDCGITPPFEPGGPDFLNSFQMNAALVIGRWREDEFHQPETRVVAIMRSYVEKLLDGDAWNDDERIINLASHELSEATGFNDYQLAIEQRELADGGGEWEGS